MASSSEDGAEKNNNNNKQRFGVRSRFHSFVHKRSSLPLPVKQQETTTTTTRRYTKSASINIPTTDNNNDKGGISSSSSSSTAMFGTSPTSVVMMNSSDMFTIENNNNYSFNNRDSETTDESSSTDDDNDNDSLSVVESNNKDPLHNWLQDVNSLVTSKEMNNLTLSSYELIRTTTGMTVKIVMLPITVPLHVVKTGTGFVVDTCSSVVTTCGCAIGGGDCGSGRLITSGGEDTSSSSSSWTKVLCNIVGHVKDEVGTVVLNLVAPKGLLFNYNRRYVVINPHQQQCYNSNSLSSSSRAGESSSEEQHDTFLDRLRLDYPYDYNSSSSSFLEEDDDDDEEEDDDDINNDYFFPRNFGGNKKSEFLLHVSDVGVYDNEAQMCYVDLKPPPVPVVVGGGRPDNNNNKEEENYINQTLDILAINALALFSDNDVCRISSSSSTTTTINETTTTTTKGGGRGDKSEVLPVQWKPEGSTQKLLKKKSKNISSSSSESEEEWMINLLEREVLVWSGSFIGGVGGRRQFPLFLARSIVPGSPTDLLRLLWDNNRVSDYNKFNLGRIDKLVIDGEEDTILSSSTVVNDNNDKRLQPMRGTKVISSETSVPFTKLSVTLSALMHARPLYDPNNGSVVEGYIIISRSLNTGRAGCHTVQKRRRKKNKHKHKHDHDDDNDDIIDKNSNGGNEIMWGINIMKCVPGQPNKTDFYSLSHVSTGLVPGFIGRKIGMMGIDDFFSALKSLKH